MDKKVNKSGGTLKISNEVLIKIAELAATEIKGVSAEEMIEIARQNGERLFFNDKL